MSDEALQPDRWPIHTNTVSPARTAIAPYNFVPLPSQVVEAEPEARSVRHDRLDATQRHSGRIECTLVTETPLYIRAGLTEAEVAAGREAKDSPEFFYLDPHTKAPVIPGSSLRGLLRALVEIVSYSKVDRISQAPMVYRAVDTTSLGIKYRAQIMQEDARNRYTPRIQAGYLERSESGWQIRPAERIGGTSFARIAHAKIPLGLKHWQGGAANTFVIYAKPGPYVHQPIRGGFLHIRYAKIEQAAIDPATDFYRCALLQSGRMFSKKSEAVIFPKDVQSKPIPISGKLIDAYRDQISKEQANLLDFDDERRQPNYVPRGLLRDNQPVLYLMNGDSLVFFGHTMLFRVPYANTPYDFVPKNLRTNIPDVAEAIFGFVRNDQMPDMRDQAWAGRVFVNDAQPSEYTWLDPRPITPRILSSPKPTTFQQYLVQEDEVKEALKHYADTPIGDTVIRGNKLYWHQGQVQQADIVDQDFARLLPKQQQVDTQHTQIKPLAAGSSFSFAIRYENLSDVELGALLWVLDLTDDTRQERPYRLKLGMGKPLGMGSIRLSYTIHALKPVDRYTKLFGSEGWEIGETSVDRAEVDRCIDAFSTYVLERCGEPTSIPAKLHGLLRIQMLLAMLSWPGPQPVEQFTRYMEIERRKTPRIGLDKNEFKARPVLPDPLHVLNLAEGRETIRRRVANITREPQTAATPTPAPPKPMLPGAGETFLGNILDVDETAMLIAIPDFDQDKAIGIVEAEGLPRRFKIGNKARVEVVSTRTKKSGRIIVTLKLARRE